MELLTDPADCPVIPDGSVVTIGVYDGVHLGHRALIDRVRAMAAELSCATAVVTFDRHPATVVRPASAPPLLTDLPQRLELLERTGIDYTLLLRFDEPRSRESAEDFVRDVLVGCLRARAVVVGHDFHFGHRRAGNVPLLQAMGARLGFDVLGLTLVAHEQAGEVSSTRIRALVADGDVEGAAVLLGRPHEVRGEVVRGDARGRDLGYPTANVAPPPDILVPGDGIYAGWYLRPDGRPHPAAVAVGRRPTFYDDAPAPVLEAHLLDVDADLYGEEARVRFVARLRDEVRFDTVEALVVQRGRDVADARAALGRQSSG